MNEAVTPQFLVALLLGGCIILLGPRKWVLPTFLTLSIFVSMGPKLVIFDQNFMIHRLLLICGWVRIIARREHKSLRLLPLDKALGLFCLWTIIGDTLLWGTGGQFVYQFANCIYDALGIYFLCRVFLHDVADLEDAVVCLSALCVVLAGFMCLEAVTRKNFLAFLGQDQLEVQVRQGRLRCQGPFTVPITAGTFGAVLFPLFAACWCQGGRMRRWGLAGCISSTIITMTAGSGGPLTTYAVGVTGWMMWRFRAHLRLIRWSVLGGILMLHLVMNAPVWALIARIQVVPGASSYHRFMVIDNFVRHFGDWWLFGIKSTAAWGWMMDDVANQYCVIGKHGGILALMLFAGVLYQGFREVGLRLREVEDRQTQLMIWGFGVVLFAQCVCFIDISYFDQIKIFWFCWLAMMASLRLLTERVETPAELETMAAARAAATEPLAHGVA